MIDTPLYGVFSKITGFLDYKMVSLRLFWSQIFLRGIVQRLYEHLDKYEDVFNLGLGEKNSYSYFHPAEIF
jgi:hypothetical protein